MGRLLKKKASAKKRNMPGSQNLKTDGDAISRKDSDEAEKSGSRTAAVPVRTAAMAPVIRKSPPESGIMGYFAKSAQFLREVRAELRKVTWPSRKQTIGSTLVVLVLVMIISFFLGVVDIGLSGLVRVVLQ